MLLKFGLNKNMSLQTRKLERERNLLERQLEKFNGKAQKGLKKTRSDLTDLPRHKTDVSKPTYGMESSHQSVLDQLKIFKHDYLQSESQDLMILKEIEAMEKEIMEIEHFHQSNLNNQFYLKEPKPVAAVDKLTEKRRELEELELQKEILLANHELLLLKQDLQMEVAVPPHSVAKMTLEESTLPPNKLNINFASSSLNQSVNVTLCLFSDHTPLNIIHTTTIPSTITIPIIKSPVRVIVDYRTTYSIGWSVFDLYHSTKLHLGNWSIPIYASPIEFEATAFQMGKKTQIGFVKIGLGYGDLSGDDFVKKPAENIEFKMKRVRPTLQQIRPRIIKQENKALPVSVPVAALTRDIRKNIGPAKKFPIGFQLLGVTTSKTPTSIRLVIMDPPDSRIIAFTTAKLSPSEDPDTYGWQFGKTVQLTKAHSMNSGR